MSLPMFPIERVKNIAYTCHSDSSPCHTQSALVFATHSALVFAIHAYICMCIYIYTCIPLLLPLGKDDRTGQHWQPWRVHHLTAGGACDQAHGFELEDHPPAPPGRRPQAAPTRHHQGQGDPRMGA